ncbi:hypothetical protein PanWU01x14_087620 [Parasponia andersonii]|uniref:Uncharacterized protein n=1 Tax=Parasponia andersonii TaxID=3476 RepID=A0A2P5D8K2_PARAD|nr:hypothetical protein PanWU01x14_087620 [Parasponia andersonii]
MGEREDQRVQPQKRKKKQSMEAKATDSNAMTTLQTTSSTIDRLSDSQPRRSHCRSQLELPPPRRSHLGDKYDATESGHRQIADRKSDVDHHHRDILSLSLSLSKFLCLFGVLVGRENREGFIIIYTETDDGEC